MLNKTVCFSTFSVFHILCLSKHTELQHYHFFRIKRLPNSTPICPSTWQKQSLGLIYFGASTGAFSWTLKSVATQTRLPSRPPREYTPGPKSPFQPNPTRKQSRPKRLQLLNLTNFPLKERHKGGETYKNIGSSQPISTKSRRTDSLHPKWGGTWLMQKSNNRPK